MADAFSDSSVRNYLSSFPQESELTNVFKSAFVINKPLSGVGGDGYWLQKQGDTSFLVVFDCVGHGRLASIMTRIYISAIRHVLEGAYHLPPSQLLKAIHQHLETQFAGKNRSVASGADMAILKIVHGPAVGITYSGAGMDLIQLAGGVSIRYKSAKRQVGDLYDYPRAYQDTAISLNASTRSSFYLFSDGITDLMGGPDQKKLKTKNLQSLLEEVSAFPLAQQKTRLERKIAQWLGPNVPLDDMLLIGIEP